MKLLKKMLPMLVFALVLLSAAPTTVFAASAPGKPTLKKASVDKNNVTLTWKKAKNASGYYIYRKEATAEGEPVRYAKVKGGSKVKATLKKQKLGVKYNYYVQAYNKSGQVGAMSNMKSATPTIKLAKVKTALISTRQTTKLLLTWKKVTDATGYEIFSKDAETGEFTQIATSKTTSALVKGLKAGTTYTFKVRAYVLSGGKRFYGAFSKSFKGTTGKNVSGDYLVTTSSGEVAGIHPYYYKATAKAKIKLTSLDNGNSIVIKKGTKVIITKTSGSKATVLYKEKYYSAKRSSLNVYGTYYQTAIYSNAVAQAYVNQKGFGSNTNYFIWVSTFAQRVYIFTGSKGKWKIHHSTSCSTGDIGTETTMGSSLIVDHEQQWWFEGQRSGEYASVFAGSGAFHSWPGGGLGHPASHGCVRLSGSEAYFIYNLPTYTSIYFN